MKTTQRGNWTDSPCWYVTCLNGNAVGYLLGPFRTEAACRLWAYKDVHDGGDFTKACAVRDVAEKWDAFAVFYSFGMVKCSGGHRTGVLNNHIRKDGLWTGEDFPL